MRITLACLLLLALAGCRSTPPPVEGNLPQYPMLSASESLEAMRQRNAGVGDVTGKGTLTFTAADGESVRLDTVFVLAPPDRARVRAWKFGRAVFDLTRTADGVWLYLPRGDARADELEASAGALSAAIGEWLNLFSGGLDADARDVDVESNRLWIRRPMGEGLTLRILVRRDTLTPSIYDGVDAVGTVRFRLLLDAYTPLGPTVWPQIVEAISADGTVRIEANELELDVAPPTAFEPPRRASRLASPVAPTEPL